VVCTENVVKGTSQHCDTNRPTPTGPLVSRGPGTNWTCLSLCGNAVPSQTIVSKTSSRKEGLM